MIRAILRAQFLSMRLRVRARERTAIFSLITGGVFYGFWAFVAWGAASFFADDSQMDSFPAVLPGGLLLVMAYWQFAPVISASLGSSLELQKLLVYPIPIRTLFLAEVLLRITSLAEMPLIVLGAAIGLARNPQIGISSWPLIFGGALIFIAMNVVLAAGVRHVVERLFLRTRLRQALVLMFMLAALLPQFVLMMSRHGATLHIWIPSEMIWPWAASARLMLGDSVALSAPVALAYLAISGWFGWWQFRRSLRYDPSAARRPERETRIGGIGETLLRLPSRFLRDPLGALLEKELRTLGRISRFRFVYGMSCVFGILLYLPWTRRSDSGSFVHENALPLMALYGLLMLGQISYWNSLGFDRAAAQGYFSWPIPFRDVLVAKNLTVGILVIPQISVIAIVGASLRLYASPGKIVETLVVGLTAAMYWCAIGNMISVRMPSPLDPDKLNQMANRLQSLSILASPVVLLPIGLAYWARYVFNDNNLIFAGLLAVAVLVGGVFYYIALDSSVTRAIGERESIIRQLSEGRGPLSNG